MNDGRRVSFLIRGLVSRDDDQRWEVCLLHRKQGEAPPNREDAATALYTEAVKGPEININICVAKNWQTHTSVRVDPASVSVTPLGQEYDPCSRAARYRLP